MLVLLYLSAICDFPSLLFAVFSTRLQIYFGSGGESLPAAIPPHKKAGKMVISMYRSGIYWHTDLVWYEMAYVKT